MSAAITLREAVVQQCTEWAKEHGKESGATIGRLFKAFEAKTNFSFGREAYARDLKFLDIVQEHDLMGDLFDFSKTMFPSTQKEMQYE